MWGELTNVGWTGHDNSPTDISIPSPSQVSNYSADSGCSTGGSNIGTPIYQGVMDQPTSQPFLPIYTDMTNFDTQGYYEPYEYPLVSQVMIPTLEIIEEPSSEPFRFRYITEMHGTHGSLMGKNNTSGKKKTYPTVALKNYNCSAKYIIRCSLYQIVGKDSTDPKRSPHSHKLVRRHNDENKCDPHDIEVSSENNFTAVFDQMGIIHTEKKNIKNELFKKICKEREFELGRKLTTNEESTIRHDAEKQAKAMNLNQVCLCFQAFIKNEDDTWGQLCGPVYSSIINNRKSALTGELKIVRMSICSSPVEGGQEVFMFVEKVCKNNIKVKFYEEFEDGSRWEAFGEFQESDVHHQYGIVLKTPKYRNQSINSPVTVKVQLFRPKDEAISEPLDFRYKPSSTYRCKRVRTDSYEMIPTTVSGAQESYMQENTSSSFGGASAQSSDLQTFGASGEHHDMGESYLQNETLTSYIGTFCTDFNISSNDLRGFMPCEEFLRFMDIDVGGESKLQTDATCINKIETTSPNEINCSLLNKLRLLIKLFKNNFDHEKLQEMMSSLIAAQDETGESLLLDCIQYGSIDDIKDLVGILIKYKLMDVINSVNELDENCLHVLIREGYTNLVKVFISLGAHPNKADAFGNTPLHFAVKLKNQIAVKELLESSATVELDEFNDDGLTPLMMAVSSSNLPVIQLLIEAGADVEIKNPTSGDNVLHMAVSSVKPNMEIIKYLIETEEKLLFGLNNSEKNALHIASNCNQPKDLIAYLTDFYKESYTFYGLTEDEGSDTDEDDFVFDEKCLQELGKILDHNKNWRQIACLMNLDEKIAEWEQQASPTRGLFKYLQESKKKIEQIIDVLDILDEKKAILLIDEMIARKFDD